MSSRPDRAHRPTIVLGTIPGRLGGLASALATANETSVMALDLDLRSAWGIPRADRLRDEAQRSVVRIRSIWLPSELTGPFAGRRTEQLIDLLGAARQDFGLRSIILPRNRDFSERHTTMHNLAREIAARKTGSDVRIAIGLQASDFRHDRWHLDQLAGIRRMAEEWDLDLALDLTGNVSPAWEAEAAVLRVMSCLRLVRLSQWRRADGTVATNQTALIAGRTIAMLADQAYSGVISMAAHSGTSLPVAVAENQQQDALRRFVRDGGAPSPNPRHLDVPSHDA